MISRESAINFLAPQFEVLGITYFTPQEFLKEGWPGPPYPMLSHILPTALILQRAREALGPIMVNSGYRTELHNAQVGGSLNSQHVQFTAADVTPLETTPQALYEWLDESGFRNRIGLGLYPSFVHVDCRHWPGLAGPTDNPARWAGR